MILKADTPEKIRIVAILAGRIWNEHYSSILSKGQIAYMVDKFQSEQAISRQIMEQDYNYYLLRPTTGGSSITSIPSNAFPLCPVEKNNGAGKSAENYAGYFALQPADGKLFLSKLYILKEFRGKGLSRKSLEFMETFARERNLASIWLTVNKYNTATIEIYKKMGFSIVRTQVAPIGGGYVMDDYVMEKQIVAR